MWCWSCYSPHLFQTPSLCIHAPLQTRSSMPSHSWPHACTLNRIPVTSGWNVNRPDVSTESGQFCIVLALPHTLFLQADGGSQAIGKKILSLYGDSQTDLHVWEVLTKNYPWNNSFHRFLAFPHTLFLHKLMGEVRQLLKMIAFSDKILFRVNSRPACLHS